MIKNHYKDTDTPGLLRKPREPLNAFQQRFFNKEDCLLRYKVLPAGFRGFDNNEFKELVCPHDIPL